MITCPLSSTLADSKSSQRLASTLTGGRRPATGSREEGREGQRRAWGWGGWLSRAVGPRGGALQHRSGYLTTGRLGRARQRAGAELLARPHERSESLGRARWLIGVMDYNEPGMVCSESANESTG